MALDLVVKPLLTRAWLRAVSSYSRFHMSPWSGVPLVRVPEVRSGAAMKAAKGLSPVAVGNLAEMDPLHHPHRTSCFPSRGRNEYRSLSWAFVASNLMGFPNVLRKSWPLSAFNLSREPSNLPESEYLLRGGPVRWVSCATSSEGSCVRKGKRLAQRAR